MDKKDVKWLPARSLITSDRFDLMAKYTYVEHRVKGYDMEWATELYSKHIEAFSGGNFKEPGKPEKNSLTAYIDVFSELIKDIGYGEFDETRSTIPVSQRAGHILDGAHRVSLMAYFNRDVPCTFSDCEKKYDYQFFREQLLDPFYLDYIATKYVEWKKSGIYVVCIWPKGYMYKETLRKVDGYIKQKTRVLYERDIQINYNGLRNLMIQVYAANAWSGTVDNHFKGITGKVDSCYSSTDRMKVYIVEAESVDKIQRVKEKIRGDFGIGRASCHSSDTYDEVLRIVHLLLNENSRHLLNNGKIDYDIELIKRLIKLQDYFRNNNLNLSEVIVDSSSILGMYGIRKTGDLDILTNSTNIIDGSIADINNGIVGYYEKSLTDLIFNPHNYAYSFDTKFITLPVLRTFKQNRGQPKDVEDVKLIDEKLSLSISRKQKMECEMIRFKRSLRNGRTHIRDFLQEHNIYFFTKLWHLLRGKGFK